LYSASRLREGDTSDLTLIKDRQLSEVPPVFRSRQTHVAGGALALALLLGIASTSSAVPPNKTVVKDMSEVFSSPAVSETTVTHQIFFTNFDAGAPGWGVVDFRASQPDAWHVVSGTHAINGNSWWCGQSGLAHGDGYDNNWVQLLQTAVPINLTGTNNNKLTFNYKMQSEPGYDIGWVMIHDASTFSAWDTLAYFSDNYGTSSHGSGNITILDSWTTRPQPVRLLFVFGSDLNVSATDSTGAYSGWSLDDVKITGQGNVVSFSDDMESGTAKWTAGSAHPGAWWHLEDGPTTTPPASSNCFFLYTSVYVPFNGSNYGTVADFTDAMLTSPPIDISNVFVNGNSSMKLQFDDWIDLSCDYGMYWSPWITGSNDLQTWTPWRNAIFPVVVCNAGSPHCSETPDEKIIEPYNTSRTGIQPGTRYIRLGFRLRDEKQVVAPDWTLPSPLPMLRLGQTTEGLYLDDIGLYYTYTLSGVETVDGVPAASRAKLARIFPNPFNPSATIEFSVPANGPASIVMYDVQGRKVATVLRETMAAGVYRVRWNGKSDEGRELSSGVYFARLEAAGGRDTARLMMLK
jgi:hypothetical protein